MFLAGSRDGFIKLYDIRNLGDSQKPTVQFRAHQKKLNQVCFSKDDKLLLSSGRDSKIRLWDIRYIKDDLSHVKEYIGHKCEGYNIGAHFMGDEEYILTGSEDSQIYLYNKLSGRIEQTYKT